LLIYQLLLNLLIKNLYATKLKHNTWKKNIKPPSKRKRVYRNNLTVLCIFISRKIIDLNNLIKINIMSTFLI